MIDCSKTVNFLKENDRMCHSIINGSECGTSCLLSYENNGTYCGCNEFMLHYLKRQLQSFKNGAMRIRRGLI